MKKEDANIQRYVTGKSLDGLYLMIGEEERKIRQDPVAAAARSCRRCSAHSLMAFMSVPVRGFALAAVLGACSPVFNWREVPIADDGLVALLPCKPDRATPHAAARRRVGRASTMTGCRGRRRHLRRGAHAAADDRARPRPGCAAWRAATRAAAGTAPRIDEAAASLPRAADSPAPVALRVRGPRTGAGSAQGRMLWFVHRPSGGRPALYQATVLGEPSSAEASATFFEGLRLP